MDPQWRPVAVGGEQPRLKPGSAAHQHQSLAPQLRTCISPQQEPGTLRGQCTGCEPPGVRGCLGESPDTGWPDRWFNLVLIFLYHHLFANILLTYVRVFVKIQKCGESSIKHVITNHTGSSTLVWPFLLDPGTPGVRSLGPDVSN